MRDNQAAALLEQGSGKKRPPADLDHELAKLARLTHPELQAEWRRLFRSPPPKRMGRELLELAAAWKLQERALGGLSPADKRRLGALAQAMRSGEDLPKSRAVRLKEGARLLREWNGETHSVLVVDGGFQWRGQTWRSLSAIAREITGARWSGPRFFGRKSTVQEAGSAGNGAERDMEELTYA